METLSGKPSGQREWEITRLIDMIRDSGATRYLEVGARFGDTLYDVMTALPVGSTGVAVDLPEAAWGRKGSADHLHHAADVLREMGYHIHIILGDSTDPEIIRQAEALGPYDAALIDGDHRYAGVKADWLAYGPMAEMVAFHDVAGRHARPGKGGVKVEVPRLWDEIKHDYPHREIIEDGSGMGIGVILRGEYA